MATEKTKEQASVLRKTVYQSNPMIQARKDFNVMGMRVFLLGLCGLNPHFSAKDKYYDEDFTRLFIPTSKLVELFGGNTKYLVELKKACAKLFDAIIELNCEHGGFKLIRIFEELNYMPREGLYLQFSQKMRPYILDLFQAHGYTQINVEYLFKLSSSYALRLLELLLQYQNIKEYKKKLQIKRTLTVEELRFALNVPKNAYADRMNNFRKYVLDEPIKEINSRTPYIVRYDVKKKGRNVLAFEFVMDTYNVQIEEVDKPRFSNDAIELLCSIGFTERVARTIYAKCANTEDCFSRINRAQAILSRNKRPIRNRLGFLRKAIEENWQVGPEKAQWAETSPDSDQAVKPAEDSMTPIGQILDKTLSVLKAQRPKSATGAPAAKESESRPRPIKIGQKQMPYSLAKNLINCIRKNELMHLVKEHLADFDTTIEKFTAICEKNGL